MLSFYRIWNGLLGLLIALQFFLAGYGSVAAGANAEAYELHIMNGRVIAAVALLGILFAALARAGGRLVGLAAIVVGLVVLQSLIAVVSVGGTVPGQIIFGFHAINALVIMMFVGKASGAAKKVLASRKEGQGAGGLADAAAATA